MDNDCSRCLARLDGIGIEERRCWHQDFESDHPMGRPIPNEVVAPEWCPGMIVDDEQD